MQTKYTHLETNK